MKRNEKIIAVAARFVWSNEEGARVI